MCSSLFTDVRMRPLLEASPKVGVGDKTLVKNVGRDNKMVSNTSLVVLVLLFTDFDVGWSDVATDDVETDDVTTDDVTTDDVASDDVASNDVPSDDVTKHNEDRQD